jgi:hypothetical protein
MIPAFSVGEWLVCPTCGTICDAPFRPTGSDAIEPELVLGAALPESEAIPPDGWRIEVTACCPACGGRIVAQAIFKGRTLSSFAAKSDL